MFQHIRVLFCFLIVNASKTYTLFAPGRARLDLTEPLLPHLSGIEGRQHQRWDRMTDPVKVGGQTMNRQSALLQLPGGSHPNPDFAFTALRPDMLESDIRVGYVLSLTEDNKTDSIDLFSSTKDEDDEANSEPVPRPQLPCCNVVSWPIVAKQSCSDKRCSFLRIIPALSLLKNSSIKLTLDEHGLVVVFTSQDSCGDIALSTKLFCPVARKEIGVDVQKLAQTIQSRGLVHALEDLEWDAVAAQEAILVLLDSSTSMGGSAGFHDEPEPPEEELIWETTLPNVFEREARIAGVDAEKRLFRSSPDLAHLRAVLDFMKPLHHNKTAIIQSMVTDLQFRGEVERAKIMSCFRDHFISILADRDAKEHASLQDESKHTNPVPDSFLCPITLAVFEDPVVAADGFTYERAGITHWLHTGSTKSPIKGTAMNSQTLVPNVNLKAQIREYQQGDADRKRHAILRLEAENKAALAARQRELEGSPDAFDIKITSAADA